MAPEKNGQRQAWIPDGGESVITILWCKMRHWWNEILCSFKYPACKSLCLLGGRFGSRPTVVSLRRKFLVFIVCSSDVEERPFSTIGLQQCGVGVCQCLCGMVITSLIKNRMEMDKDS